MPAADELVQYLSKHRDAPLTEVVGKLLQTNSLDEVIGSMSTLSSAGFVAYECRITLRLTPMGEQLAQAI